MPYLTNYCKSFILEVQKALALQTASSLPACQKIDRTAWESWRSIFFCMVAVHVNLPHDVKHGADSVDDERQRCDDLRDCHVCSPPVTQRLREVLLKLIEPPPGLLWEVPKKEIARSPVRKV